MCIAIDVFQSFSSHTKCVIVLFIINSVFTIFYFTIVSLIFSLLEKESVNRSEHWVWIFSGLVVLIWAVLMLTITIIWCMCRNYALRKDPDNGIELGDVSEKVKKTLGVTTERSNLITKPKIEEIKIENAEITPLPEYSPEARNSIFDFSEEVLQKMEQERAHSPFQEYLHLVQQESPGTPTGHLHRISEEPMYDIPLQGQKDGAPLIDEENGKQLKKKKSQMFLGNIGKSSSVVSELFVEVDKGSVIPESVVVMGRYQVLSELN